MDNNLFNVDPTPDGPDEDANARKLQEEYKAYVKAFEEEFGVGPHGDEEVDPEKVREKTKELLTIAVPKAVASLLHLAQHAKSESARLNASRFIIETAIGKDISGLVGDPFEKLLADLNSK